MPDDGLSRGLVEALRAGRDKLSSEEHHELSRALLHETLAAAREIAREEGGRPWVVALTLLYGPGRVTVTGAEQQWNGQWR